MRSLYPELWPNKAILSEHARDDSLFFQLLVGSAGEAR